MLKVGLTGGIGCGKSVVCGIFSELGVPAIDTDELARLAVRPGSPVLERIVETFGASVLRDDGSLNRDHMRQIVFSSATRRRQLEQIVHPEIRQLLQQHLAGITAPYVVIAIPLLLEKGWHTYVDRILVVDCDESLQLRRAMERDGSDEATIRAIIASQIPRRKRLEHADDIIHNDADFTALRQQVEELHRYYTDVIAGK